MLLTGVLGLKETTKSFLCGTVLDLQKKLYVQLFSMYHENVFVFNIQKKKNKTVKMINLPIIFWITVHCREIMPTHTCFVSMKVPYVHTVQFWYKSGCDVNFNKMVY